MVICLTEVKYKYISQSHCVEISQMIEGITQN